MDKQTNEMTRDVTGIERDTDERKEDGFGSSRTKGADGGAGVKSIQESDNFMALYEESLRSIQEGELVKGEIVQVDKEFVLVDIGYKSEGQIPISEFIDSEGNITAKVGDQMDVLLEKREDDEGLIILSKEKAAKIKIWDDIKDIYEKGGTIRGKILSRVKGGMSVDIGLQAFLPGSQIHQRFRCIHRHGSGLQDP